MNARSFISRFTIQIEELNSLVKEFGSIPKKELHQSVGLYPLNRPEASAGAPTAALISPHPDDDIFIAAAALRLQRYPGYRIENIVVTLGSDRKRQQQRKQEVKRACDFLNFSLQLPRTYRWHCLENINPRTRSENPKYWNEAVNAISYILSEVKPRIIFMPHQSDWHPTHVGANLLVRDSLEKLEFNGDGIQCFVLETEVWKQMEQPNLMVESPAGDVKRMVMAFMFHTGEIERSDYPLRLPWTLAGNVMRSEVIKGQGESSPRFGYATLYRAMMWRDGKLECAFDEGRYVSCDDNLEDLFLSEALEEITVAA